MYIVFKFREAKSKLIRKKRISSFAMNKKMIKNKDVVTAK